MSQPTLLRTPLYDAHVAAGGRLVEFGGYELPVQYSGVVEEHRAVREAVGLFDVSHMGEVELRGPRALEVANEIVTNDLGRAADGQAMYTAMCRPSGGIIDDLVVYRVSPERIFICVNASNRTKDFEWIREQAGTRCEAVDLSDEYAQIAVQGPRAAELLTRLANGPLPKKFRFHDGTIAGRKAMIAGTGYTGEAGCELYVANADARAIWDALMESGADLGVRPCGLGARDSLRLEVCLALYGNDIDETTNPYEAGLGWVVKLNKPSFVGKEVLTKVHAEGPTRSMVGLEVTGRGIGRHGYPVLKDGARVGEVTSGTMGPTVGKAIALAYVPAALSAVGTELDVEIRGKPVAAQVVAKPFLKR